MTTDTILNTDCGKTVQLGTGATGFFTETLPSVSGFDPKCKVNITNGDTARAKGLSGFPVGAPISSPARNASGVAPAQSRSLRLLRFDRGMAHMCQSFLFTPPCIIARRSPVDKKDLPDW